LGSLTDRRGFHAVGRGAAAEHGDNLVAGDEFSRGGRGLAGFGMHILDDELERAAEHAAAGVENLHRECEALARCLAETGFAARERFEFADADRFSGAEGAGDKREECEQTRPNEKLARFCS